MFLSRIKFIVVACVALLQCFVPLIHAHAHEVPGKYHVHIHADELDTAQRAPGAMPEMNAPDSASMAIGVSQEFKRDFFLLPILGLIVVVFLLAAVVGRHVFSRRLSCAAKGISAHSRPPATAPPVQGA